jgi:hypothetical protein
VGNFRRSDLADQQEGSKKKSKKKKERLLKTRKLKV